MERENTNFRIVPVPIDFAPSVRRGAPDSQGNRGITRRDGERHQCRHCLTLSREDETVLLVSYRPFASTHPFAECGPIFVHERDCEPYRSSSAYPAEFPRHRVVLRAYNASEEIEDACLVGDRRVEDVIEELFANPRVSCVHARNSELGCFMFRIERP